MRSATAFLSAHLLGLLLQSGRRVVLSIARGALEPFCISGCVPGVFDECIRITFSSIIVSEAQMFKIRNGWRCVDSDGRLRTSSFSLTFFGAGFALNC